MQTADAIAALGSLAQETRLAVYRLLVKRGPEGLSAGAIAEALDVPSSSLSFHLHQLMHAGLISQERQSRQLIYAANYQTIPLLIVASLWYLIVTTVLTIGQYYIERHYAKGSSRQLPRTFLQRLRDNLMTARGARKASAPSGEHG